MAEQLPVWHNAGVEPPDSLKNTGWQPGIKPSAQHMNWLLNRTYNVLKALQENGDLAQIEQDLSELETKVTQHLNDMTKHNQFMLGGKLHQLGFGYNSTLGCVTWSIREVTTQ